jgi:hypothetical protein
MPIGGCLSIQYTGASASCILLGDAAAKTLTSKIGAAGAEAVDAAFGTAGVFDLTAVTVDTLAELAAIIEAYVGYTCSIVYGDDIATGNIVTQGPVQAKGVAAYVYFSLAASVLSATALTTWARYQAIRGADLSPDSDQTTVEYLINSASEQAEMISSRRLKARAYSATASRPYDFDGNGRDKMLLPEFPVNSIAHLYIDSARAFGASTELTAGTDYLLDIDVGMLILPYRTFTPGYRNVRVERNAGWATVPDYVQEAVIETVAWTLSRVRGSNIGMRTVASPAGVSSSYEIEIPMSARRVFESLKDWRL